MYDKGLAERLTERVGDMFEMEVTYMFGGFGYLMNSNICVAIWNDMLVIRVGVEAAIKLATVTIQVNPITKSAKKSIFNPKIYYFHSPSLEHSKQLCSVVDCVCCHEVSFSHAL